MAGFGVRRAVIVAFVVVSLAALLVVAGCGSGSSRSSTEGTAASDQPTVKLGGYTFASNSNVLTHPDLTAHAGTPQWVGQGYGDARGLQMTMSFSAGGKVAGVNALHLTIASPGGNPLEFWLAQDTQGNVHYLKAQFRGDPAPRLTGVAAGQPPYFWLPRAAAITPGRTWYDVKSGTRLHQDRILSTSATWRGATGLVQLREIHDDNGDGNFSPVWSGPDSRHDMFSNPTTHMPQGVQGNATSGYVRSH